jgi:murein L,D-transpeptidase YafK
VKMGENTGKSSICWGSSITIKNSNQQQTTQIKTWWKDLKRSYFQKKIGTAHKHMKRCQYNYPQGKLQGYTFSHSLGWLE